MSLLWTRRQRLGEAEFVPGYPASKGPTIAILPSRWTHRGLPRHVQSVEGWAVRSQRSQGMALGSEQGTGAGRPSCEAEFAWSLCLS
jgi:hypothetical protein